jgi:hypothetical protein
VPRLRCHPARTVPHLVVTPVQSGSAAPFKPSMARVRITPSTAGATGSRSAKGSTLNALGDSEYLRRLCRVRIVLTVVGAAVLIGADAAGVAKLTDANGGACDGDERGVLARATQCRRVTPTFTPATLCLQYPIRSTIRNGHSDILAGRRRVISASFSQQL